MRGPGGTTVPAGLFRSHPPTRLSCWRDRRQRGSPRRSAQRTPVRASALALRPHAAGTPVGRTPARRASLPGWGRWGRGGRPRTVQRGAVGGVGHRGVSDGDQSGPTRCSPRLSGALAVLGEVQRAGRVRAVGGQGGGIIRRRHAARMTAPTRRATAAGRATSRSRTTERVARTTGRVPSSGSPSEAMPVRVCGSGSVRGWWWG